MLNILKIVGIEIKILKSKNYKLLAQTKNIQAKHSGQVVRRVTVRCKSIFPAKRRQHEY